MLFLNQLLFYKFKKMKNEKIKFNSSRTFVITECF